MEYNYIEKSGHLENLMELVPSLNFEFKDEGISILRYVVNNTVSDSVTSLKLLVRFVNNMLWFRSLDEFDE